MNRSGGKTNLKAWGSPEDSNVVIYIDKQACDAIYRHGSASPKREVVGILLGNVSEDSSNKYRIDIVGIVKSESAPANQTQAQFTHQVWLELVESAQKNYPNQKVVGWYHTHPGFKVFMSDDDVKAHRVAFSHPWHVAAICDPIKNKLSFFGWDGSQISAISGFYTYETPHNEPELLPLPQPKKTERPQRQMPALMIPVLVAFLAFFTIIGLIFTVWLPGERKETNQPSFQDFPVAVVPFLNEGKGEIYDYYFIQNNGEVWRQTLNNSGEVWNKENSLPITLKQIVKQPTVDIPQGGNSAIGTLELQAQDEKEGLWLLRADILSDGRLTQWQKTVAGEIAPATGVSLSFSEKYLFFGTTRDTIPLNLYFTGNGNLSWRIITKPSGITLDKESGVGNATINITEERSQLSPGDHADQIVFSYDGDTKTAEVITFVTVAPVTGTVPQPTAFKITSIKDESDDGRISRDGEKVYVTVQNTGQSSGAVEVSIDPSELFTVVESPEAEQLKPGEEFKFAFKLKPKTQRSGVPESLIFRVKNPGPGAGEYDEEAERFFAP